MKVKLLFTGFICCIVFSLEAQYIDLPTDINWNAGDITLTPLTVDNIESAYNYARTQENTALGTSIPMINFPSAAVWNTWSNNKKAFWILNEERTARGLIPFENYEQKVIDVAQNYCQYLVDNDTSGHIADGHGSNWRLIQDPAIASAWQATNENISYYMSSYSSQPQFVVERLIYSLIYEDIASSWGHRHNFFKSDLNDDSGQVGKEGIIGVGVVISQGYKDFEWCAIIVTNFVDPNSTWVFTYDTTEINNIQSAKIKITKTEIIIPSEISIQSFEIIDIYGRKVKVAENEINRISIENLPTGVYTIVINSNNKVLKEMFVR